MNKRLPYEYGSDLHWLYAWALHISDWLALVESVGPLACMAYRPDPNAEGAVVRLTIERPTVARQIQDNLLVVERAYDEYRQSGNDAHKGEAVADAMSGLSRCLLTACEAIHDDAPPTGGGETPAPTTRPMTAAELREFLGKIARSSQPSASAARGWAKGAGVTPRSSKTARYTAGEVEAILRHVATLNSDFGRACCGYLAGDH